MEESSSRCGQTGTNFVVDLPFLIASDLISVQDGVSLFKTIC